MINIKIRDFRGCERADIVCSPIALVAGRNAAGKSSIAQAVGAALTGAALPVEGMTKAAAGALVHTGASDSIVEISNDTGTTKMAWPMCQGASSGEAPPRASSFAAGLASVAAMDSKDRARILCQYLKAEPDETDFAAALRDAGLDDIAVFNAMWKLVSDNGWDGAHLLRKDKGAELKGRWRQIAGANYGSRIAANWKPQGWLENLEDAAEEDLRNELDAAKKRRDRAIAEAAVSDAEIELLRRAAVGLDEKRASAARYAEERTAIDHELATARADRAKLPGVASEIAMPCPHCATELVVRRLSLTETKLEKAEVISTEESKQRRLAKTEIDSRVNNLERRLTDADTRLQAATAELTAAERAALKLREAEAKPTAETSADVALAAADGAARRLEMFQQKQKADDIRDKIASNDLLLDILGPEGLRKKKLGRVVDLFNDRLAITAESANWARVSLDEGMVIAYGGRPYGLLSASEQYRVRIVLQLAMAQLDKSNMVVIDAADMLDAPTRSGIFSLLQAAQLPALVCLTLSRRDQLPDLATHGIGQSSWIENGICGPLSLAEAA